MTAEIHTAPATAEAPPPQVSGEEVTKSGIKRELPVKLAPTEMLMIAIAKAKAEGELETLNAQFEDVKADWKQRIADQEKRIAVMGVELRTSEQKRVVVCYERYKSGTIEVVREDTRDVVERRAASLADTQRALPGTTPAAEAAAASQKQANVQEDEDGDVVPPESNGKSNGKANKKKR